MENGLVVAVSTDTGLVIGEQEPRSSTRLCIVTEVLRGDVVDQSGGYRVHPEESSHHILQSSKQTNVKVSGLKHSPGVQ